MVMHECAAKLPSVACTAFPSYSTENMFEFCYCFGPRGASLNDLRDIMLRNLIICGMVGVLAAPAHYRP